MEPPELSGGGVVEATADGGGRAAAAAKGGRDRSESIIGLCIEFTELFALALR